MLTILGVGLAQAQALSDALLLFPSNTQSIEYDNLAALRTLPNYAQLRQRYHGVALKQALTSFRKLGIGEDMLDEVVMAANDSGFYGLALGPFSGKQAMQVAARASFGKAIVRRQQITCPESSTCVWFFEDSTAVFGTQSQLRNILDVWDGGAPHVTENTDLASLLPSAPHTQSF